MNRPNPVRLGPVLIFTATYIAGIAAVSLASETPGLGMYLGLMAILIPVLYQVHRHYPLGPALLWSFSLWGLLHMTGGLVPIPSGWSREGSHSVFYSWWLVPGVLKFDQVVHAYGFGITTWLCWHILKGALRSPDGSPVRPTLAVLILCVAGGMGFGALNEVVEFIATLVLPDTNVGDYTNLGWDLVANLVGSCVAAFVIYRVHLDRSR
jgi:uncharacterized membrane protein YjdF